MKLKELLRDVPVRATHGNLEIEISAVTSDSPGRSRIVVRGDSRHARRRREVHRFGDSANQILPDPHGYRYLRSMPTSVQKPIYINGSC